MCKWTRQWSLWGKRVGAEYTLFVTTVIYIMEILENGCLKSPLTGKRMICYATAHKSNTTCSDLTYLA